MPSPEVILGQAPDQRANLCETIREAVPSPNNGVTYCQGMQPACVSPAPCHPPAPRVEGDPGFELRQASEKTGAEF